VSRLTRTPLIRNVSKTRKEFGYFRGTVLRHYPAGVNHGTKKGGVSRQLLKLKYTRSNKSRLRGLLNDVTVVRLYQGNRREHPESPLSVPPNKNKDGISRSMLAGDRPVKRRGQKMNANMPQR